MAFRDRIEAILQAKDVARFKSGMKTAAKAVKDLGQQGERTEAILELMESIEKKLEHQTYELSASLTLLAERVDEVGDELVQMAAKAELANKVMKKSGSNAVFLGKSWAFWKDRLSLTRSEIMTTSLTIGTYLSPALIALGSNFVNAAIGGGAVGAAGLSTFLFGLGSLGIIAGKAKKDIDKIQTAQQQLLVTQEQYGHSSIQASRANAHLYATIQQFGGPQAANLLSAGQALRDRFYRQTAPARRDVLGIAGAGIGAGQRLLPTYSRNVNRMAGATSQAAGPLLKRLSGEESKGFMNTLGDTFSKSIGPVAHAVGNMFLIIGRVVQASAPYVVEWAKAWDKTTTSWEKGLRSRSKLNSFISQAVTDFKLWVGFAKELFRTFKIIFGATKEQGNSMLTWLTKVLGKFNDWLEIQKNTGAIDRFYQKWKNSLRDIFWAVQHPLQAIDIYLPMLMDHIATAFAHTGPRAAELFITAWWNAGAWAKFFTVAILLAKFGVFSSIGGTVAKLFIKPFMEAFLANFALGIVGASAADGAIGKAMTTAGTTSGTIFGRAFRLAAIAAFVAFAPDIANWIQEKVNPGEKNKISWDSFFNQLDPTKNVVPFLRDNAKALFDNPLKVFGGKATGGAIGLGQSAWVGESGMELATATPYGTSITPMGAGSTPQDVDLRGAIHLILHSHLHVDKREIASAVKESNIYDDARRGKVTDVG